MHPLLEKDILKQILEYLQAMGFFCWRNNTGAQPMEYKGRSRFLRFGKVGSGDILGIMKDGRFFTIEVKRPGQKPTPAQVEFMDEVRRNGGIAVVATSVYDVIQAGFTK